MKIIRLNERDVHFTKEILLHLIDPSNRQPLPASFQHWENLLSDDRTYLLGAIEEDNAVGYTLAYRFPSLYAPENMAYLYDIEVALQHRRHGIGRSLVESLFIHLRADSVNEVWLGTAIDNPEGQAFFRTTGAVASNEIFNDYTYYLT